MLRETKHTPRMLGQSKKVSGFEKVTWVHTECYYPPPPHTHCSCPGGAGDTWETSVIIAALRHRYRGLTSGQLNYREETLDFQSFNSFPQEAHKRKAGAEHKSRKKRRQPPHPQHIHHNLGHLIKVRFLSQELSDIFSHVIHHINHIWWYTCNPSTQEARGSRCSLAT